MTAGFLISAVTTATASYFVVVIAMVGMGGGLGLVRAPATESIMGSLPPAKAGVGSAVNDTTRELGGTLGVAVVRSVFASPYGSKLTSHLAGLPIPASALKLAKQSIGAAFAVAGHAPTPAGATAITSAAREGFMRGFHAGALAAASSPRSARSQRGVCSPHTRSVRLLRSPTPPNPTVEKRSRRFQPSSPPARRSLR